MIMITFKKFLEITCNIQSPQFGSYRWADNVGEMNKFSNAYPIPNQ